jgi:hypothetical protein
MTSGLPLRKALASLRDELHLAQDERGAGLGLRIDSIELELAVELDVEAALKAEAGVEGKLPWLVVGKARTEASAQVGALRTHRLTLSITPLDLSGPIDAEGSRSKDGAIEASGSPSSLVVGEDRLRIDPSADTLA